MKKNFKRLFAFVLVLVTMVLFACDFTYAQKKPMTHRKKDAIIGGVAGAGVGAAVSHKKGKGALIGGAAGAAAGYLHGKSKDKKAQ